MRMSFRLGTLFGIPIRINYTWFLIFGVTALSLGIDFLPRLQPGLSPVAYGVAAVLGSLLFFASVLAHELAHSLAARARGLPVHDITLFIFGGVASVEGEVDQPGGEILMAGVGPATSLVLAGLFAGAGWLLAPINRLGAVLGYALMFLNLSVAVFNLLPGFPLDGGRIFRAVVWKLTGNYRRATGIAATVGRVVSTLLIGGGILWALMGNLDGLWLAFVGWFLDNAATQSYRQVVLQDTLRGVTVADLMTGECERVPRGLSVSDLVEGYLFPRGQHCFVVADGDTLQGLVTVHSIRELARERWPFTPVGEIMIPYERLVLAHPQEDALAMIRRMDERRVSQMPVVEGERFLGMVTREGLLRYLRTRAELGM
jgi:Zn-dependent protease